MKNPLILATFWLVFSIGVLAGPHLCQASGWRVIPIRLDLSAKTPTGTLRVINEDPTPLNFQIQATRWMQDATGKDILEPSDELIFFPKLFTIPAGEERLIRAGIKVPASTREKSYRLFIEQIPDKGPQGAAQVSLAIRFGVPVFSRPPKIIPSGKIQGLHIDKGTLKATVINEGNSHFKIRSLKVKGLDASGKETFSEASQGWYVLSGAERVFDVPLPADFCSRSKQLALVAVGDIISLDGLLDLTSEQCSR